jgi:ABC-2 type transport system ATP-binding protein
LDVSASREVRGLIREWLDEDKSRTLLLTTHYMVEADELCDRIAIINRGRLLACDKPSTLKQCLQKDSIFEIETSPLNGLSAEKLEVLPGIQKVTCVEGEGSARLNIILNEEAALAVAINALTAAKVRIMKLTKHEPTLEDVFVTLVGHSMTDIEQGEESE